jgi:hypothetical protein
MSRASDSNFRIEFSDDLGDGYFNLIRIASGEKKTLKFEWSNKRLQEFKIYVDRARKEKKLLPNFYYYQPRPHSRFEISRLPEGVSICKWDDVLSLSEVTFIFNFHNKEIDKKEPRSLAGVGAGAPGKRMDVRDSLVSYSKELSTTRPSALGGRSASLELMPEAKAPIPKPAFPPLPGQLVEVAKKRQSLIEAGADLETSFSMAAGAGSGHVGDSSFLDSIKKLVFGEARYLHLKNDQEEFWLTAAPEGVMDPHESVYSFTCHLTNYNHATKDWRFLSYDLSGFPKTKGEDRYYQLYLHKKASIDEPRKLYRCFVDSKTGEISNFSDALNTSLSLSSFEDRFSLLLSSGSLELVCDMGYWQKLVFDKIMLLSSCESGVVIELNDNSYFIEYLGSQEDSAEKFRLIKKSGGVLLSHEIFYIKRDQFGVFNIKERRETDVPDLFFDLKDNIINHIELAIAKSHEKRDNFINVEVRSFYEWLRTCNRDKDVFNNHFINLRLIDSGKILILQISSVENIDDKVVDDGKIKFKIKVLSQLLIEEVKYYYIDKECRLYSYFPESVSGKEILQIKESHILYLALSKFSNTLDVSRRMINFNIDDCQINKAILTVEQSFDIKNHGLYLLEIRDKIEEARILSLLTRDKILVILTQVSDLYYGAQYGDFRSIGCDDLYIKKVLIEILIAATSNVIELDLIWDIIEKAKRGDRKFAQVFSFIEQIVGDDCGLRYGFNKEIIESPSIAIINVIGRIMISGIALARANQGNGVINHDIDKLELKANLKNISDILKEMEVTGGGGFLVSKFSMDSLDIVYEINLGCESFCIAEANDKFFLIKAGIHKSINDIEFSREVLNFLMDLANLRKISCSVERSFDESQEHHGFSHSFSLPSTQEDSGFIGHLTVLTSFAERESISNIVNLANPGGAASVLDSSSRVLDSLPHAEEDTLIGGERSLRVDPGFKASMPHGFQSLALRISPVSHSGAGFGLPSGSRDFDTPYSTMSRLMEHSDLDRLLFSPEHYTDADVIKKELTSKILEVIPDYYRKEGPPSFGIGEGGVLYYIREDNSIVFDSERDKEIDIPELRKIYSNLLSRTVNNIFLTLQDIQTNCSNCGDFLVKIGIIFNQDENSFDFKFHGSCYQVTENSVYKIDGDARVFFEDISVIRLIKDSAIARGIRAFSMKTERDQEVVRKERDQSKKLEQQNEASAIISKAFLSYKKRMETYDSRVKEAVKDAVIKSIIFGVYKAALCIKKESDFSREQVDNVLRKMNGLDYDLSVRYEDCDIRHLKLDTILSKSPEERRDLLKKCYIATYKKEDDSFDIEKTISLNISLIANLEKFNKKFEYKKSLDEVVYKVFELITKDPISEEDLTEDVMNDLKAIGVIFDGAVEGEAIHVARNTKDIAMSRLKRVQEDVMQYCDEFFRKSGLKKIGDSIAFSDSALDFDVRGVDIINDKGIRDQLHAAFMEESPKVSVSGGIDKARRLDGRGIAGAGAAAGSSL